MPITSDTKTFGVGPWELDVEMARRLGYSEEEINSMCDALGMISRSYNQSLEERQAKEKQQ